MLETCEDVFNFLTPSFLVDGMTAEKARATRQAKKNVKIESRAIVGVDLGALDCKFRDVFVSWTASVAAFKTIWNLNL